LAARLPAVVGKAGTELVLLFFEKDPELCPSARRRRPHASVFVGLSGSASTALTVFYIWKFKISPRVIIIKTDFFAYVAGVVFVFGVVIVIGFCVGAYLFTIYGGGGGGSALSFPFLSAASASAPTAKAKAAIAHGGLRG
jgi:hypothetical protein